MAIDSEEREICSRCRDRRDIVTLAVWWSEGSLFEVGVLFTRRGCRD